MNDGTMRGLAGGRTHTETWFERMMDTLAALRSRHDFRILFGGAGAWQLAQDRDAARRLGVDVCFCGYGERDAAAVFAALADGRCVEPVLAGRPVAPGRILPILGPTSMGVVEASRGCGWGCAFCTMAREPMIHLPVETIAADVRTNVENGVDSISLVSEDLFRYGAAGRRPDPRRLLEMLEAVRATPGLRLIQLDHVNVGTTVALDAATLRAIHDTIVRGARHEYLWVNLGVETASGELLAANQGAAKIAPHPPAEWGRVCHEAVDRLIDAGFLPMVSLIFGLPGETDADVNRTLRWVQRLAGRRLLIFPLFHEPVAADQRPFTVADMTPAHWRLLRACYALNFRWGPRMHLDNLRGAGAPWLRRAALRIAGRFEVLQMKCRFALRSRSPIR
jgi:radical SAM superfamily enzyme YgiQ (UPF0313 family)